MPLPKTVIVFGGSGFIGRNFVQALADRDIHVIGVNRTGCPISGCAVSLGMDRLHEISDVPNDVVVVNLAAHCYDSSKFKSSQSEILLKNVELATAIYHFCAERDLHEVRLASSLAVYPASLNFFDDGVPVDLNQMPNRSEAFYGWSKRWAEQCAALYQQQYGINTVAFRLSNPYGPYDSTDVNRAHVTPAFILRALSGQPEFEIKGNPNVERDFIYVGDVVEVFLQSLQRRGEHRSYNLCTGTSTSIGELAREVMRAAGVEKPLLSSGAAVSEIVSRPASPTRLMEDYDIEEFTPLASGLRTTIEWYRHELGR
ncbi:MAG: NAD(P)-dependent oxidoreductase [Planctomycetes bacterium]|nr:NAD(P)-dependent oxidoreductase [Planctomycetota bacterium]